MGAAIFGLPQTKMIDFALDNSTGDLVIENGQFKLVSGAAEIAQRIKIHLSRFLGEWFLNTTLGLPWYSGLLGSKDSKSIELAVRRELGKIYGVRNIITLNIVQSGRSVSLYAEVNTIYSIQTITFTQAA